MPSIADSFAQYSSGIADAAYAFDIVRRVTIPAGGTSVAITFNLTSNVFRIRNAILSDQTASTGGTAPGLVACYFRIDGQTPSAGVTPDGTASRILRAGAEKIVARYVPVEVGVLIFNPNATAVVIQVELGA